MRQSRDSLASASVERAPRDRGTPCGRACCSSTAGTLRCRAGSRDKSTERRPSLETGPNKKNSSAGNRHGSGPRIAGTHNVEDDRRPGRKQFGQDSSLIVGNLRRVPRRRPEASSGEKQFKSKNLKSRLNCVAINRLREMKKSSPGQSWVSTIGCRIIVAFP